MKAFILFVTLFVAASAQQKCPENSSGTFPNCKCLNGAVYDPNYNWCSSNLADLNGQCPEDGPGIYPNCNCGVGKRFNPETKVCTVTDRSVCPKGSYGTAPNCQCPPTFAFDEVHWFCRPWYLSTTHAPPVRAYSPPPACGAYQYGTYPDCHYRPCPKNSLNPEDFEPHCRYNYTHHVYTPCPQGEIGHYPNCYVPCPPHHRGKYPNCERIRCQTGDGWSGEFEPDCKYTPSCPPEFPGVWPNCDIYKAKITAPPSKPTPSIPQRPAPPTHSQLKGSSTEEKSNTYLPPTTTTTPKPALKVSTTPGSTYLPPSTTTPKPALRVSSTTTTTTRRPSTTPAGYLPPQ